MGTEQHRTLTKVQTLLFDFAAQLTGGCALTLGKSEARLRGGVDNKLSGANVGKPFGAD
jgi:hypothetical protein